MDIATGQPEDHPTPLPLDFSATPGVQAPAARFPGGAEQGAAAGVSYQEQMAGTEAAASAAQAAGHAAENARRQHYESGILPLGTTAHGDAVTLPEVPAYTLPPASSSLFPWPGLLPGEAAAAVDSYPGR